MRKTSLFLAAFVLAVSTLALPVASHASESPTAVECATAPLFDLEPISSSAQPGPNPEALVTGAASEALFMSSCAGTTSCNTVNDCPCPTPGECYCVTSTNCGKICLCREYCWNGGDPP